MLTRELAVQRFSARNLPALLALTARRVPHRRFIREIVPDTAGSNTRDCTFGEFAHAVFATAESLANAGIKPSDRILFLAENSTDFQILLLATQLLRAEPCPIFASMSASGACDIARRIQPTGVFVSSQEQWDKLSSVANELVDRGLKFRISLQTLPQPFAPCENLSMAQMRTTSFVQSEVDARIKSILDSDPCLLLFTSGTTGKQKGVVIRQDAFVRSLEGGQTGTGMTEADDGLMFLPFAHVAGQCQFMLGVALGHSLILVARREDLPKAFQLGPTYSFAVPMVYEKLKQRVERNVAAAKFPLRPILSAALTASQATAPNERNALSTRALAKVARLTIGRKLQRTLGGKLRLVACGGAAASPALAQFFETLGLPFLSIYGMSETAGLIFSQHVQGTRHAHGVGCLSPDLEMRLSDTGELTVRGPLLMQGYLDEADNALAFDAEGYFHTGDLVAYDSQIGEYQLVGRCKALMVLGTGKKVSPEPIEALFADLPYVQAALLVGEGRPYVSIVLFILPTDLEGLKDETGTGESALTKTLLADVANRTPELSDYERPKRVLVVPWAPGDVPEFVTPTMKLRRDVVVSALQNAISRLYENDGPKVQLHSS